MYRLYGIKNCDTIKKAKKWLESHNIDYQFHDYKTQGVPQKELKEWVKQQGWQVLLNKRSTTWRKLDDTKKNSVDESSAIEIMLDNSSIIKRPVLAMKGEIIIGFDESCYERELL